MAGKKKAAPKAAPKASESTAESPLSTADVAPKENYRIDKGEFPPQQESTLNPDRAK